MNIYVISINRNNANYFEISQNSVHKIISKQTPIGFQTITKIVSENVIEIDDFMVIKLGTFSGDKKPSYIGVFNTWINIV